MGSMSIIKIIGHAVFAGKSLKLPTKKASGGATGWSEKYWKDRDQEKGEMTGVPLYPAFAAFPGPMAPPMPGIPIPLIACPSAMSAEIFAPSGMKSAMIDALDGSMKQKDPEKHHEALFEAIATALSLGFLIWT